MAQTLVKKDDDRDDECKSLLLNFSFGILPSQSFFTISFGVFVQIILWVQFVINVLDLGFGAFSFLFIYRLASVHLA